MYKLDKLYNEQSPNDRFVAGASHSTMHLFSQETHCPQCSAETPPLRTNASGLFASTNSPQAGLKAGAVRLGLYGAISTGDIA